MGWQIASNAKIGFKLHVTVTLGSHSLYDWCCETMWLFSVVPDNPENDTLIEKHGADVLYSAMKRLLDATWTEDDQAQQNTAHQMIQITKPWMIRMWLELNHANRNPPLQIPKMYALLFDLESTEAEQAQLKALVERYTSCGTSGAWRAHLWQLACVSLLLGDM
jgi:hypothetical protein